MFTRVPFPVVYYLHGERVSLPALIDAGASPCGPISASAETPTLSTSLPAGPGACCPERSTTGPAGALGPHVLPAVSQTECALLSCTVVVLECD